MLDRDLLREPLWFLARFAVVVGVLYLLRADISTLYLALVTPPANWLLGDMGATYVRQGHELGLVYSRLGLRFTVHDIIYQNLLVAVALFAATRARPRWKLAWGTVAVVVLWASHVVSLYLGGHVIIWDFLWGLPPELRQELGPRVAAHFPAERDWLLSRLFGLWHTWGRQSLVLAIWGLASLPVLQGVLGAEPEAHPGS